MTYPIDRTHRSPNWQSRQGKAIRMIVLHATVGSFGSALNWLINPVSKVSSHYLISKGGAIDQLVDDDHAAWHAGKSFWLGLTSGDIELCSLGVELENANDGHDPWPAVQLDACHWLCERLVQQYEIERAYVVRHLDIATPRGRKTDPAGFPWPSFADGLYAPQPPAPTPQPPSTYRVRAGVTAGATIRSDARRSAAQVGSLRAGDRWVGSEVHGETVALAGFQASDVWVCQGGRCVWSGLLERV